MENRILPLEDVEVAGLPKIDTVSAPSQEVVIGLGREHIPPIANLLQGRGPAWIGDRFPDQPMAILVEITWDLYG
jgi:hypothetical protein